MLSCYDVLQSVGSFQLSHLKMFFVLQDFNQRTLKPFEIVKLLINSIVQFSKFDSSEIPNLQNRKMLIKGFIGYANGRVIYFTIWISMENSLAGSYGNIYSEIKLLCLFNVVFSPHNLKKKETLNKKKCNIIFVTLFVSAKC